MQQDYLVVQQKVERGDLSPGQQEEEAASLKARESAIEMYEQEMVQQLQDRRNELLEPISHKLNRAIADVAREQNLSVVFDAGILVKIEPAFDVLSLVKRKLGISAKDSLLRPCQDWRPCETCSDLYKVCA